MMARRLKKPGDNPAMSDVTLLLSVEDLIDRALGPLNCNVVNYKLVQTILHIIARQMRLLEQLVEIRADDLEDFEVEQKKERKRSPPKARSPPKKTKKEKSESPEKTEDKEEKVKVKVEKEKKGDKGEKEKPQDKPVKETTTIKEVKRDKEKVLVDRRASISVVTRSEFELMQARVDQLQRAAGPLPPPAMPSNKKLRTDIAKGSASLTDTMEAMQLAARLNAAEQAITQMGDLLTQLAASGALPRRATEQIAEVKLAAAASMAAVKSKMMVNKSVGIDPTLLEEEKEGGKGVASKFSMASHASLRSSMASRMGMTDSNIPGVTHPEMDVALQTLKEELMKQATMMTTKATSIADNANLAAKAVADKLSAAIDLSSRITVLNNLVTDYAQQLNGLETGLTSQMSSFRDQMAQMSRELASGLQQLALVNNNAETAAVMELTERYEILKSELDRTLHEHSGLTSGQHTLSDELRSLVECVEMLREQKADRDEVLDGLRDKADISRLTGLLTGEEFALTRADLEMRLAVCHDKFSKQEAVWMTALKDLLLVTEEKAELTELLAACEHAEQHLRDLHDMQEKLALILGEPKAAMIMRAMCKDANCASCLVPALMEPEDPAYGAPPPLPALRPAPAPPCAPAWRPPVPPDHRDHICNRWVGGSHTLLSAAVTRGRCSAPPAPPTCTRRFTGTGNDGRLYQMEEDLQPCVECNQYLGSTAVEQGAGDQEIPNVVEDAMK